MWFWLIIWIAILVFNTVHSFLPNKLQSKKWIRRTAMIIASLILIRGVYQELANIQNRSSAYVSSNGEIIESHNFPWKIAKTNANSFPIYVIEERYGDSAEVKVESDRHVNFKVYNAIDGVAVKFFCEPDDVPSFRIRINQ